MHILDLAQVRYYLRIAEEVAQEHCIVDAHVHASEIVFRKSTSEFSYGDSLASKSREIAHSQIGVIRELESSDICCIPVQIRNRSSEIMMNAAFRQVGTAALAEEMEVSHVGRALLLPVAPKLGDVEDQLRLLSSIRAEDSRFSIGYSLPNNLPVANIRNTVADAVTRFGIQAVKLHPNLSGVNLQRSADRVYALLEACGEFKLPIIVHGGKSPILGDDAAADYATLHCINSIDWTIGGATVVIAHCGLYGCHEPRAISDAIPLLQRILSKHLNVLVDTSGVSSRILAVIFGTIDHERIVFGSDALYSPMWRAVVTTLHGIALSGAPLVKTFTRVGSDNPSLRLHLDQ
jgi:Amidohydrolase